MTTTNGATTEIPLAETCDVCCTRRAIWMSVEYGHDFIVCACCREGEPCDRCGVERDLCKCAGGPFVQKWLPLAAEG